MECDVYCYYVVVPFLIFVARIIDVSLGTIRIILVSKGYKKLAPIFGFFEVLIWIIAISSVMRNLENWISYIAYAGGFAMGTYVGMRIDERLAIGYELIRIITRVEAHKLVEALRNEGYGTTVVKANGSEGEVAVIFVIIKRKNLNAVVNIIRTYNPRAFYTIEDIRFVNRTLDLWQTHRPLITHE